MVTRWKDALEKIDDWRWVGGVATKQTQEFWYDELDRLRDAETSEDGTWGTYTRDYEHDDIGNLTSKAGVSYTYPSSGEGSVRPHAVTSTSAGGTRRSVNTWADPAVARWDSANCVVPACASEYP